MSLTITGRRSELGALLARQTSKDRLHFNVAGQQANTLLHDGHAWKDFDRLLREGTRRALRARADMLVHASFAFVRGQPKQDPLRSIAATILDCEDMVLSASRPACVLRLGYLYGPQSKDLLAYRTAFRLGRPYWAGPLGAGQYHLHHDDAVHALLAAADVRHAGRLLHAVGSPPLPFMKFMDHFARCVGRRCPLHVPRAAAPLMKLLVRKEHMQQVALPMPEAAPSPALPAWRPRWADPLAGLDQVVASWQG